MWQKLKAIFDSAIHPAALVTIEAEYLQLLLDGHGDRGERLDIALDLGASDSPEVESVLLAIAGDPEADSDIAELCGESLAAIWMRQNRLPLDLVATLQHQARQTARFILRAKSDEWAATLDRADDV